MAETREIGGKKFTVEKLKFGRGEPFLVKLIAVGMPAIGSSSSGANSMAMLANLGGILSGELVKECADLMGSATKVNINGVELSLEKAGVRESVFDDDYLTYFEWLGFALEVQYKNFFVGLLARLGQPQQAATT